MKPPRSGWPRAAVLSVLLLAGLTAATAVAQSAGRLVFRKSSLYHDIYVYQYGSVVTLQFGRRYAYLYQSQVDVSNPRLHMLEYTRLAFCGLLYKPEPKRLLVLGLGGGVIPREMRSYFPEMEIDVAEIDPEVPPTAERYFGFRTDEKLRVHVDDGRVFVRKELAKKPVPKYDIVILDAFNSDYIPFHLMTKEFLEEVKGILSDDGVVVANVFYDNQLCDAEMKTFLAVFGRCQAYFAATATNAMLVALGPKAPELTAEQAAQRAAELQGKHRFAFDLPTVAARLRPDIAPNPQAMVLTDDRAPVDWLRDQKTPVAPAF